MLASSCALAASGSGLKATLCGPPLTLVSLIASPTLIVRFAGSKLYPFSSPSILTSHVFPVGAIAFPAAAGAAAGAAPVAAGAGVAGAGLAVAAGAAAA